MAGKYWTYSIGGDEERDSEYETCAECIEKMEQEYSDKIQEESDDLRNGEFFQEDAEIIRFRYNDEGDREVGHRSKTTVEYEHYHGDRVEHGVF